MITNKTVSEITNAIKTCNDNKLDLIYHEIRETLKCIQDIHKLRTTLSVPNLGQISYDIIATIDQINYDINATCENILEIK